MSSVKTTVVLNKELKEKLIEYAQRKNISINSVIRLAISELLERDKK